MNAPEANERIGYIDGCRALAVLGVVIYHCVCHAAWAQQQLSLSLSTVPMRWLLTILAKGAHGVDLFFVISGFCLSYPSLALYYRQKSGIFYIDRFGAKRMARILPPYYIALSLCLVALFLLRMLHAAIPSAINPALNVEDVIEQIFLVDRATHLANGAFWTLFLEFRWYIAFPILLALWLRSKRAYGALLLVLLLAFNYSRARSVDIGVLPAFMLGIVAADWKITEHAFVKRAPLFTAIALDCALLLEPFASMPGPDGVEEYGFCVQGNVGWYLVCFFFVLAAGSWKPLRTVLEMPVLVGIGVISYSIYLVHQPIVSFFAENMAKALGPLPAFGWGFCASLTGGALFWYAAERPFCKGGRLYASTVAFLEGKLGRLLSFAGIPRRWRLRREYDSNQADHWDRGQDSA